jgi:hypothetical protein
VRLLIFTQQHRTPHAPVVGRRRRPSDSRPASGTLRRNNFFDVRDGDFQRGINRAVANKWIKLHIRDRYTYQLTDEGFAAGWKPEPANAVPAMSGGGSTN